MIGQPALVPLVKAFVLARCHFVLRLWRKKKNCESLVFETPIGIYREVNVLKLLIHTTAENECRKLNADLSGLDQRSSAIHVILRVHDKHHFVCVKFKSTVQAPGVLHAQLAVPLSPAAHRLHLPHLPPAETPQVPKRHNQHIY